VSGGDQGGGRHEQGEGGHAEADLQSTVMFYGGFKDTDYTDGRRLAPHIYIIQMPMEWCHLNAHVPVFMLTRRAQRANANHAMQASVRSSDRETRRLQTGRPN
jgi:hypothetical protein